VLLPAHFGGWGVESGSELLLESDFDWIVDGRSQESYTVMPVHENEQRRRWRFQNRAPPRAASEHD